ncbi:MAG: T9SS type A sorting domain-containing protein [Ignavibacteriae bacterium]|nr:T9SS C-terminal target domain-containing protein [Ignavibacteriota bacterium]NOH00299.1 T9SS type A sorting domain-containing protein [Ignavibacteriota bacterium]
MKKSLLVLLFFVSTSLCAQNNWNLVWSMNELPFQPPQIGSEMAIVKAGFDTDEDGFGEFLCAYTDLDSNFLMMYEASADDTYDLVWYWKYPIPANTFAGIVVGDMDNNGVVEIITTMPSVVGTDPNPDRLWVFEWNGVQGENKYGRYTGDTFTPTNTWNFNLADGIDFRPYSLTIEDIDNDSKNELIVGVRQSANLGSSTREVLVASVTGLFSGFGSWNVEYNFQDNFGGSLYSTTTGDLDGDGNREIYALVWNEFTFRILECLGDQNYVEAFAVDNFTPGIDHGAVDGVRVADVNNDGVNELYIAGTEPNNALFIITGINDVSAITPADINEFYHIPVQAGGKFRSLSIADSDQDGNLSLLIAGERNGQIFDLEYNGSGDPADSASWTLTVAYDIFEHSGLSPDSASTLTPRFFYGSPASDMDGDGKSEYVFVNYSTDHDVWTDDAYVRVIESDVVTNVSDDSILPNTISLSQNYPNPFNPTTNISFNLVEAGFVSLKVYDILGNEVANLVEGELNAGKHNKIFNARNLTSGVYFYTLTANNFKETKKLMLMK